MTSAIHFISPSQRLRGLKRWSTTRGDSGSECCQGHEYLFLVSVVFSGRGFCFRLITQPTNKSYSVQCV